MAGSTNGDGTRQSILFRYLLTAIGAVVGAVRTAAKSAYEFLIGLQGKETSICILLFIGWVGLFAIGATVPAQNIVCKLSAINFPVYLPAITITYAYSNIAFLALLSGSLGGFLSRLSLDSYVAVAGATLQDLLKGPNSQSIAYQMEPPIASAIRSFAIYLLYIAGISIVVPGGGSETVLLKVDPSQYVRIAGVISAVGFAVGYDPTIFTGFLSKLNLGQRAP
ncbi:MAG: hypothetical protein U1E20_13035 [Methylocystis sp.]|uniref:hypothetical protein n=1 Tax=Methylocystis sp. TaxID=1911079 RepID=UPI0039332499